MAYVNKMVRKMVFPGFRLVFKNTLWQILGRGVMLACSFLAVFLLTRLLGAEDYGDYLFLTTAVLLSFNLADFGTSATAVKMISQKKINRQAIFTSALVLKMGLSLFSFLVFNLAAFFLPQFAGLGLAALIASLSLFFLNLRTAADILFMADLRFEKKVFFEVFASVLFLLASLILFFLGKDNLVLLIIFWVLAGALSGLGAILLIFKKGEFRWSLLEKKPIKNIFKEAFPLGLRQLVFATYDEGIDNFFIKTFLGSVNVAYYGLAYKIYGNLILLAAFFMNSLFPVLAGASPKKVKEMVQTGGRLLFLAGLALGAITFLLAPFLVRILGGEAFLPSMPILRLLCPALVAVFLNHLFGYLLVARGEQRKLLWFSLLALAFNLGGNWLLIPRLGTQGAAIITLGTELLMLLLGGGYWVKNSIKY
ncbi:flippase [Candidatus Shapirobacteria bacterium]|nr:flippase [Candidatus Shapirobacteria bacterium]